MDMQFGDSGDEIPEFLRHIFNHMQHGRSIENINPDIPITLYPEPIDIPLYSRVTLTPAARKRFKLPKEPNYGILVYKMRNALLFPQSNDPTSSPEYWDCVVAVAPNDDPNNISLFAFHSTQLRIPKNDNLDELGELDTYRLPIGRQFMIGDEVCINPDSPDFDRFRYAKYPCKAIITDVYPGVSFMSKNISTALEPIDLTFRCVVDNDGECRTFYGFSGNFVLLNEAASSN